MPCQSAEGRFVCVDQEMEVDAMATERGYYREEMLRAVNNIEMALTHLTRLVIAYEKDHPDISNQIKQVCEGLVMCGEVVTQIHDQI